MSAADMTGTPVARMPQVCRHWALEDAWPSLSLSRRCPLAPAARALTHLAITPDSVEVGSNGVGPYNKAASERALGRWGAQILSMPRRPLLAVSGRTLPPRQRPVGRPCLSVTFCSPLGYLPITVTRMELANTDSTMFLNRAGSSSTRRGSLPDRDGCWLPRRGPHFRAARLRARPDHCCGHLGHCRCRCRFWCRSTGARRFHHCYLLRGGPRLSGRDPSPTAACSRFVIADRDP